MKQSMATDCDILVSHGISYRLQHYSVISNYRTNNGVDARSLKPHPKSLIITVAERTEIMTQSSSQ
uniref:Uncharacterized protein n=1 Tax=Kalanchoe fedtschenkoi TaxID=63787 RepID=A0A7N0V1E5_KALFE